MVYPGQLLGYNYTASRVHAHQNIIKVESSV